MVAVFIYEYRLLNEETETVTYVERNEFTFEAHKALPLIFVSWFDTDSVIEKAR